MYAEEQCPFNEIMSLFLDLTPMMAVMELQASRMADKAFFLDHQLRKRQHFD